MIASAPSRPVELPLQPSDTRQELARMLGEANWNGDVEGVVLAVHEAMVNAHRHGGGVTRVTAGVDDGSLLVNVSDRGPGFGLPESADVPDVAAERGRGLFLIRELASDVRVAREGGNVSLLLRFEG
jgi:anti-sigma regulatory factor (Ser/Thr protein kinase)